MIRCISDPTRFQKIDRKDISAKLKAPNLTVAAMMSHQSKNETNPLAFALTPRLLTPFVLVIVAMMILVALLPVR